MGVVEKNVDLWIEIAFSNFSNYMKFTSIVQNP